MKYLSKLFAFDDRQSNQSQSSAATLTSNLYTVTFIQESDNSQRPSSCHRHPNHRHHNHETGRLEEQEVQHLSSSCATSSVAASAKIAFRRNHQISSGGSSSSGNSSTGGLGSLGDPARDSSEPPVSVSSVDTRQKPAGARQRSQGVRLEAIEEASRRATKPEEEVEEADSGIIGYLLAATIGKSLTREHNPTSRINSNRKHIDDRLAQREDQTSQRGDTLSAETEDDDWILLNNDNNLSSSSSSIDLHARTYKNHSRKTNTTIATAPTATTNTNPNNINIDSIYNKKSLTQLKQQMALDKADIELIKASWVPVRKDPQASGVLLFKGLFIKFPQYLKFFPQFADLDLERMHTNSRLLSHAVRVINTVTFVVDAIGDESKASQLDGELVKLVKSHLRRKIGTPEFRNLGIVLIDFICDVFGRGGPTAAATSVTVTVDQLNKSGAGNVSINTFPVPNSETMTSALDKLRASSSPSSSSEEESYLGSGPNSESSSQAAAMAVNINLNDNSGSSNYAKLEGNTDGANNKTQREARQLPGSCNSESSTATSGSSSATSSSTSSSHSNSISKEAKIDTNLHLVAAWTKLYNIILDLVKREETASASAVGEQL